LGPRARVDGEGSLAQEDPDADVMGKLMDLFKKKPPKEEE